MPMTTRRARAPQTAPLSLREAPTPELGQQQMDASSEPKQISICDAGHELTAEARSDRANWLAKEFGLGGWRP